jgi:hypothetical protein
MRKRFRKKENVMAGDQPDFYRGIIGRVYPATGAAQPDPGPFVTLQVGGESTLLTREQVANLVDAAVAAERERIRAALMDMHRKTADHNYYHCAAVTLFGA